METPRALQDLAPASLPPGTEVGSWRVLERRGRGNYGTVYRVERKVDPRAGPFALKLASHPLDPRFEREAELLSRVRHPGVPRLHGHGLWPHPAGPFPYLVMEWVEGQPLYEWARERHPTSRQVLRLLAQVARALEATHAVGAVHRDVKGDNVLVREHDGRAILTDFGAGNFRGAPTLTAPPLPPGTPPYRSPEAVRFQWDYRKHPTAHYESQPADDVFALGVTAYQLVTGSYPPPPRVDDPVEGTSPVTSLVSPRVRNPAVCSELDALILRMLAERPEERLGRDGTAGVAHALEAAAHTADPQADLPLSDYRAMLPAADARRAASHVQEQDTPRLPVRVQVTDVGHAPVRSHPETDEYETAWAQAQTAGYDSARAHAQSTEHGPARAHAQSTEHGPARAHAQSTEHGPARAHAQPTEHETARAHGHEPPLRVHSRNSGHDAPRTSPGGTAPSSEHSPLASHGPLWWAILTVAVVVVPFLSAMMGWLLRPVPDNTAMVWTVPSSPDTRDGGTVAVGDAAVAAPVTILAPVPSFNLPPGFGLPMPDRPFPGQRKPPCNRKGEVELRGGCWYELARVKAPCDDDAYDYKGACYLPSFPVQRPHTSGPADR